MAFFLRLYRITALAVWLLFIILFTIPYQFRGWNGVKKINRLVHLLMTGAAKIINLRVKLSGEVPDASAGLVVSNHLSYLDIIAHGSVFPIRYSPKSEIAKWPILGWVTALSHPIWIKRKMKQASKETLKDFAETAKHGINLLVYPEGTSSDGKSGVLPFKSTLFEAAVAEDLPVIPVLTRYREAPGRTTVCWYGDMTLLPHLWQVLGFPSIESELHLLPPVFPEGRSRKEMASHVHELLSREYNKIIGVDAKWQTSESMF
ncbi:MAG: lysophospholipid acyltransferase family protein [Candidatus Omnitrophota bacterium]